MASNDSILFNFGGNIDPLKQSLNRAGTAVSDFATKAAKNGFGDLLGPIAKVAAAVGSVGAVMKGLHGALDLGAELQDLSNRIGVPVAQAAQFRKLFRDSGVDVNSLGGVFNKMQRSLAGMGIMSTAKSGNVLKGMGLDPKELAAMAPEEAFVKIGTAINNLGNPTERAAAAMAIFGKSGGQLLQVFASPEFKNAGELTNTARLLGENAASFKAAHEALAQIGPKLTGFFVGMASGFVPALMPVLEEFKKLDLSSWGVALGNVIGNFVTDWQRAFGDLTKFTVGMLEITFSPTILKAFALEMTSIATKFGDEIRKAISGAKGSGDSSWFGISDNKFQAGVMTLTEKLFTGNDDIRYKSFRNTYAENLQAIQGGYLGNIDQQGQEGRDFIAKPIADGASALKKQLDDLLIKVPIFTPTVATAMANDAGNQAARDKFQRQMANGAFNPADLGGETSRVIADSLTKIGGGGNSTGSANPILTEARRQTTIQTQMRDALNRFINGANGGAGASLVPA